MMVKVTNSEADPGVPLKLEEKMVAPETENMGDNFSATPDTSIIRGRMIVNHDKYLVKLGEWSCTEARTILKDIGPPDETAISKRNIVSFAKAKTRG